MEWVAANPVAWIVPGLLVGAWIALRLLRRPVWPWFFLAAAVLAVSCFPAGMFAGRAELAEPNCTPGNLCFSADEVDWWLNGLLGLLTTCALAVLTAVVDLVLALVRRESADPAVDRKP
ncbi:hypothetical protein I0C86_34835 [Plantactinospora sp. S1510]|uniref:Integral membrane protein n=1 Tax=Plantactinospora alkalitolerans TaxID=2789879 RepID=A0ABS0H6I1_9ACTN|nr:hypothetical protein [Plantactinospora alkalitolerans]MBF9134077.1 hypothetical protein [Plantactinospora alkalitolerans]